jgi:hypothetical protein
VAFLALALGIYVIRANPNARVARVFLATMVLMFACGCLDYLFMNAAGLEGAYQLARLLLFLMVLMGGAFFYLATFLPYERSSGWFRHRSWLLFLPVGAVAFLCAAALGPGDLDHTSYGWGVTSSLALGIWAASLVFLALSADLMLALVSRTTSDRKIRAQIAIVALAVTAPVIYGLMVAVLEEMGASLPPVQSPGFLVSAAIMAYAVLRYRLFAIDVLRPASFPAPRPLNEYGITQVFLEKKGTKAFEAFFVAISRGAIGAIFSRTHPDLLEERYHLEGVPMIWLAQQPGEGRVDPANLGILQHSIMELYRQHEGAVVLLEGVEYLLSNNPLESVLKTLYALDDEVVIRRGLFILTLDPEVLPKQHLAIFVRDFNVVE